MKTLAGKFRFQGFGVLKPYPIVYCMRHRSKSTLSDVSFEVVDKDLKCGVNLYRPNASISSEKLTIP
jgi:hypothetical protein